MPDDMGVVWNRGIYAAMLCFATIMLPDLCTTAASAQITAFLYHQVVLQNMPYS